MLISIRHTTTYTYDPAVDRCAVRLRLYPPTFASQRTVAWSVRVNEVEAKPLLSAPTGEGQALWTKNAPVDRLEITAEGCVDTENAAGLVLGLEDRVRPSVYLRETSLTTLAPAIEALAKDARSGTELERLHRLSRLTREAVDYAPGATDPSTTAAQALQRGVGVCQDHAHVFIAASRALGLPSRYVVGYLLADGSGHLYTHAWAESHISGLGWVGFDPANRVCPTDQYVRLCCGFDADDAAPLRGTHGGGSRESLSMHIDIAEMQQ